MKLKNTNTLRKTRGGKALEGRMTDEQVANRLGISRRTVHKYKHQGAVSKIEAIGMRNYRTRIDPLEEIWPQIEKKLEKDCDLRAIDVINDITETYGNKFKSQRTTIYRRIKNWHYNNDSGKNSAKQKHFMHSIPGSASFDFTHLKVEVTIREHEAKFILAHYLLTHSGQSHVEAFYGKGEKYSHMVQTVQNAAKKFGGTPMTLLTDSFSGAFTASKSKFRDGHLNFCSSLGIQPLRTRPGEPCQNGSVESKHRHLKQNIVVALKKRGSSNFDNLEEFQKLLQLVVDRMNENAGKVGYLTEDIEALRPLDNCAMWGDYSLQQNRVETNSLIQVYANYYSVPARLIGCKVQVRVYARHIEVYFNYNLQARHPRLQTSNGMSRKGVHVCTDHVIRFFKLKPGGFSSSRMRDSLLDKDPLNRLLWEKAKRLVTDRLQADIWIISLLDIQRTVPHAAA